MGKGSKLKKCLFKWTKTTENLFCTVGPKHGQKPQNKNVYYNWQKHPKMDKSPKLKNVYYKGQNSQNNSMNLALYAPTKIKMGKCPSI
jgi:hypothetical protein